MKGVEREAKRALSATSETGAIEKQLVEERRKLQNLVSAIEAEGVSAGSARTSSSNSGPWRQSPVHTTLYLASAVYPHWSFCFYGDGWRVRFWTD